jgi:hypothetical protein
MILREKKDNGLTKSRQIMGQVPDFDGSPDKSLPALVMPISK